LSLAALLDRILVPRPNGSRALEDLARFLGKTLEATGARVAQQDFAATPHGFALCWAVALLLMLGWAVALASRRHKLALALCLAVPALLYAEFEALHSPVSGLWPATERNVIGVFPGQPGGPLLVFAAHYDSTTDFGSHGDWTTWGWRMAPALGVATGLALLALGGAATGRGPLPRWLVLAVAPPVLAPFVAMAWFQTAGPLLRAPSPGAVDNGGSVAVLLRLAERLASRPAGAPAEVRLVFLASEEERALGSRAYARSLERDRPLAVYNLETTGTPEPLGFVPEDGFDLRRFDSPRWLVALVDAAAAELGRPPLAARPLPKGTLSDGRSFLAEGLPALTLRAAGAERLPAELHSAADARERLSPDAIEATAGLLEALVGLVDREPGRLAPGR
jgi:Peptidase family M28